MFFARLVRLLKRDLKVLLSEPRVALVILGGPFLFTLLFGSIYLPRRVSAIPTWLVDQDRSSISRSIRSAVLQNESFRVVREGGSEEEFRAANRRGEAYVLIWIPRHLERDLKHGRGTRLLALIDGSNMLIANTASRGVAEIGGTFSAGVSMKRLSMRGTPSRLSFSAALPLETSARIWYNPAFNYMDFMLPGCLCIIIQQITLLGVALAFADDVEKGLFAWVLDITDSAFEILLSKSLLYTSLNLGTSCAIFLLAKFLFGVGFLGSLPLFCFLLALFVFALVGLGLFCSAILPDKLFATQLLMVIASPSFLISGYTWPQFSMVGWLRLLSDSQPVTHFALALRQVLIQGGSLESVRPHILWLWTMAFLCYGLAYLAIGRLLRKRSRFVLEKTIA